MTENAMIECWIAGKVEHLQNMIDTELQNIKSRNQLDSDSMFANAGNTDTLKWNSQIDVLRELEEFLDGIDE